MREPLFRRALAADVPAIVTLVNAANSGDGNTAGWTNEAHLFHGNRTDEAEVAQLLAAPGARFVLSMGVCERIAYEELGCERLGITVITSHRPEVAAFYERRGFVRTGKFKSFERKQAREGKKIDGLLLEWMEKILTVPVAREGRARFMPTLI
jgi:hypothetical protein